VSGDHNTFGRCEYSRSGEKFLQTSRQGNGNISCGGNNSAFLKYLGEEADISEELQSRIVYRLKLRRKILFDAVEIGEGLSRKEYKQINGNEFISKILDRWAYENDVSLEGCIGRYQRSESTSNRDSVQSEQIITGHRRPGGSSP
jgi:hypothetical protein